MSQIWRHYRYARLVDMHDGDTCAVEIDHGCELRQLLRVRLYGVSCPEVSGEEKPMGQDALRVARTIAWDAAERSDLGIDGTPCEVWTWKASFGRYVGRVVLAGGVDLARAIITAGHGYAWDGKTERRAFAPDRFPLRAPALEEVAAYERLLARDFRP